MEEPGGRVTGGTMDRRRFLLGMGVTLAGAGVVQVTGLGGLLRVATAGASGVPGSSAGPAAAGVAEAAASATGSIAAGPLVLVTLYGGNDGLNTVIPYDTGAYHDWRGSNGLAIGAGEALAIGKADGVPLGLHPSLTSLQSLWNAGRVAIVNGVEYPKPNFSHFASQDIWQTAELSGEMGSGWLGRWLDATGSDPWRALSVGPTVPTALVGDRQKATSLVDSTGSGSQMPGANSVFTPAFRRMSGGGAGRSPLARAQAAAGATLLDIGHKADAALAAEHPLNVPANGSDLSNQLSLVAELIQYGLPTSVYSVSFGSFDTHSNQSGTHAQLLAQLDAAIGAFMASFPTPAPGKNPVLLVTSEFGRTPRANASGGTDHGTSSVVLVAGPGVKGGFYGEVPSFTRLDPYGNQIYTTDFRRVYATALEHVLHADASRVLGGGWAPLTFL